MIISYTGSLEKIDLSTVFDQRVRCYFQQYVFVSALQSASDDFEKCYQAFLKICSARAFSKECASEDVQAYCIGAFWLSDMSWNLVEAGEYNSCCKPGNIVDV
jgi:hypothetical protein